MSDFPKYSINSSSPTPLCVSFQSEPEERPPFKLPKMHKRRPPPGTRLTNDLGTVMQMNELTANDKAVLWSNYQKAMVRASDSDCERKQGAMVTSNTPFPCYFE